MSEVTLTGDALRKRIASSMAEALKSKGEVMCAGEYVEIYMTLLGDFVRNFVPEAQRPGFAVQAAALFIVTAAGPGATGPEEVKH